ncbi:MAG TPA: hypothetical protein VN985_09140 [Candidatus Eisenbacteria bacterium]|nr:hypothetical protein [Candidatus Eisenbacteria bacterium]
MVVDSAANVDAPVKEVHVMRPLAWLLVVTGVLIIIAGPIYSSVDPRARDRRWFHRAVESGDRDRVDQMLVEDVRAAWVVVSPWPIVMAGASVTAFGVLLLAIRRP